MEKRRRGWVRPPTDPQRRVTAVQLAAGRHLRFQRSGRRRPAPARSADPLRWDKSPTPSSPSKVRGSAIFFCSASRSRPGEASTSALFTRPRDHSGGPLGRLGDHLLGPHRSHRAGAREYRGNVVLTSLTVFAHSEACASARVRLGNSSGGILVFLAGVEPQAQIVVRTAQGTHFDHDLVQELVDLALVVPRRNQRTR